MPFVKIAEVKAGDTLLTDGGFTCMGKGKAKLVKADAATGDLYISCRNGRHYLVGQADDKTDEYVGLTKPEAKP